jgi:hypothetical protein
MKMEQTECSETLAYKLQTPGNYPEESIQQNVSKYFQMFSYTFVMRGSKKEGILIEFIPLYIYI